MTSATTQMPISRDTRVRYIKLGEAGSWEKECCEKGIVRFGFAGADAERFGLSMAGRWKELTQSFITGGKDKRTATRFTNETRLFFEDDGQTLWIFAVGQEFVPEVSGQSSC